MFATSTRRKTLNAAALTNARLVNKKIPTSRFITSNTHRSSNNNILNKTLATTTHNRRIPHTAYIGAATVAAGLAFAGSQCHAMLADSNPSHPDGFVGMGQNVKALHDYAKRLDILQTCRQVFEICATHGNETQDNKNGAPQMELKMNRAGFLRSRICRGFYYDVERARRVAEECVANKLPESLLDLADSEGVQLTLADFEFLSALLVIPEEDVAVAFKVFDTNGNGVVDVHEFRQVRDSILRRVSATSTSTASNPKSKQAAPTIPDRSVNTSSRYREVDLTWLDYLGGVQNRSPEFMKPLSGDMPPKQGCPNTTRRATTNSTPFLKLVEAKLFGKSKKGKLSVKQFSELLDAMQLSVLTYEYAYFSAAAAEGKPCESHGMTIQGLARSMVNYAPVPIVQKLSRNVDSGRLEDMREMPVSFEEFAAFDRALCGYETDLASALDMFNAGSGTSASQLQRAVQIVAKEELPLPLLLFIPRVFGSNNKTGEAPVLFDHRVMLNVVAGRIDANRLGQCNTRARDPRSSPQALWRFVKECMEQNA